MKKRDLDFEISFFEGIVRQRPDYVEALIPLAEAYTRKGLREQGLRVDQRLSRLCKDDPIVYYNLACSLALTQKPDEALKALQKAIRLGYRDYAYMRKDPDLQSLSQHPGFKKMTQAS
jgi:tetratricopeptide (TPR) repeat protein